MRSTNSSGWRCFAPSICSGFQTRRVAGSLTDLRVGLHYQLLEHPFAFAPFVSYVLPVRDYYVQGHASQGRGLEELLVGFGLGKSFDPWIPRTYAQVRYTYGFVEKVGNIFLMARKRVRKDLRLYRHFLELNGEETGEWRGEISAEDEGTEGEEAEARQADEEDEGQAEGNGQAASAGNGDESEDETEDETEDDRAKSA